MTFIFFLATIAVTAGLFIDAYFYPGALLRYTGVDSKVPLIILALVLYIARLSKVKILPEKILNLNKKLVFPVLVAVSLLFVLLENLNYETYVLGTFGFHFEQILVVTAFSGYFIYLNRDFEKYLGYQKFIYLIAPLFLFGMVLLNSYDRVLFYRLRDEDYIIEYAQFFAFLAASFLAIITAKIAYNKHKLLALFSVFLGLGLLFIAGEEISWGQRIIGFEAPQFVQDINYQNELTIHNIEPIHRATNKYCFGCFIGVWGVFGFYMVNKLKFIPKKTRSYLTPLPYLVLYFLITGVHALMFEYSGWYYEIATAAKTGVHRWQEIAELYMAIGFLMFTWDNYKRAKNETITK
jgi:hypothetical protein